MLSRLTLYHVSAVLAFLPAASDDVAERELSSVPSLSTGILSATQGNYIPAQLLLDITQGARVSYSAYSPALPPPIALHGDRISGWPQVLERAQGAPQLLQPGLLAGAIPGGGAYAGIAGTSTLDGVAAADRSGRIAAVSLGTSTSLPARIATLQRTHDFVVADLPTGAQGNAQLHALAAARLPGELLIVVQKPPAGVDDELLWIAVGGLGGGHTLTSTTTEQRGLVAAIDIAPSILHNLDLAVPADVRGAPLRTDGVFEGSYLRGLKARLQVVYARRLPALAWLLALWAALLALTRRAWALRMGALALLWTPTMQLLPAALEPSRASEYALLAAGCFALAALTDRLMPWPRAPLVPAIAAVVALSVDALAGTQLLIRSLLGPDPAFGARFYGIGNELKSGLAVLVFAAVAAALYPLAPHDSPAPDDPLAPHDPSEPHHPPTPQGRRRAALTMALAGVGLAIVEGSARIGAGVGGVILVCAGTAVATAVLLPGRLTRRRALTILIAPLAGLVALAALDLATAHGSGHFTGSILHARSAGDVRDVIARRYKAAYEELKHGLMPAATGLALLGTILGVRDRERLLAPVERDPLWQAAFAGGLTAGVVGALSEDSGPVLLVVAVFALLCLLGYLWGGRRPDRPDHLRPLEVEDAQAAPALR